MFLMLLFLLAPFALYLAVTQGQWFRENLSPRDRAIAVGAGVLLFLMVSFVTLGGRPRVGVPIGFVLFLMSAPLTLTTFMLVVSFGTIAFRRSRKARHAGRAEGADS